MSETTSTPARPVSLITTIFIFVLFAAFIFVARHYYHPTETLPQVAAPENLAKDFEWKATRDSRKKTLQELRETQSAQVGAYKWIDQKAGAVQLPIERAMELTAQKYGAQQQMRQIRDLPDSTAKP
jgi:hypothetical protein